MAWAKTLDRQAHQSRSIGELKRMLKQVIETQERHSQRFEAQSASLDELRESVSGPTSWQVNLAHMLSDVLGYLPNDMAA